MEDRIWSSYVRGLRLKKRSELTIDNYSVSFRALLEHVETGLTSITRMDIEEFFEARQQTCKDTTVLRDFRNLRAFFNWAVTQDWIPRSPMAGFDAPYEEETLPRVLENRELQKLISVCRGSTFLDRRDEAIIRLMSEPGGPRRGEILMNLSDIDFRHDLVRLVGKTGERFIPYSNRTGAALDRYLKRRDRHRLVGNEALWLTDRGSLTAQALNAMMNRRGEEAGLGKITCRTLRHTAAHRCKEAEMSGEDMQTLFGWSGPSMLLVYGRTTKKVRAQNASRRLSLGDRI